AEGMAAEPNSKAYGSLTNAVQNYTHAELVINVLSTVFLTQPNVTSSVLHIALKEKKEVDVTNEKVLYEIVRPSFAHRSKTILNKLGVFFKDKYTKEEIKEVLNESEIDPKRRGESLSIAEFAKLSNQFLKK